MAFPTVARTEEYTASANGTLVLTPSVGQLVVVIFVAQNATYMATTSDASWQQVDAPTALPGRIWSKKATGTQELMPYANAIAGGVFQVLYINGGEAITGEWQDNSKTGGVANSPLHQPGIGVQDFLWLSIYTSSSQTDIGVPANYTLVRRTDTSNGRITSARLNLSAASEDPGAWTSGATFQSAWTLAVYPTGTAPLPIPVKFIGAATGTNTATLPPHQAGDLIIAMGYRDGSATIPGLATGWTNIVTPNQSVSANSARIAKFKATGSAHANPSFQNASSVVVLVYRPGAGYELDVGAVNGGNASSSTAVVYPALSLTKGDGTSIVAGLAGHRSTNTNLEIPPTGMVNRATVVDSTDEASGHDTNKGVTSWPATTVNVGGTASGWFAASIEIMAIPTGSPPADTTPPTITSPNSYSFAADDSPVGILTANEAVTWTVSGTDAANIDILPVNGNVYWEYTGSKTSFTFVVKATDPSGNFSQQTVTATIASAADTTAPTITSLANHSVDENSPYSAVATANESVTWAKSGTDQSLVTLNSTTGAWSVGSQDHETKPVVTFLLTATDSSGNFSHQTITLNINDLDEIAPVITSSATGSVQQGNAFNHSLTADEAVIWSKISGTGSLTGSTLFYSGGLAAGVYETVVRATDAAGNYSQQTHTLTVTSTPPPDPDPDPQPGSSRPYHSSGTGPSLVGTGPTTWGVLASLTFTPKAGVRYAMLWSAEITSSGTNTFMKTRVMRNGVVICEIDPVLRATSDFQSVGMPILLPADVIEEPATFSIEVQPSSGTMDGKNGRIVAIGLKPTDLAVSITTEMSSTSAVFSNYLSLNAPAGDFLVMGGAITRLSAGTAPVYVRVGDGINFTGDLGNTSHNVNSDVTIAPMALLHLTSPGTLSLQARAHSSTTAYISQAHLIALDLTGDDYGAQRLMADAGGVTQTSYVPEITLSKNVSGPCLVVSSHAVAMATTSGQSGIQLTDGGLQTSENTRTAHNSDVKRANTGFCSYITDYSPGPRSWTLDRRMSGGSTGYLKEGSGIFVMSLGGGAEASEEAGFYPYKWH